MTKEIDLRKRSTGLACYFRFVGTDYIGIAVADSVLDLFWNIDQYGDPFQTEIAIIRSGSVCFKRTRGGKEGEETEEISEVEYDEGMEDNFSRRSMKTTWRVPIWPELNVLYGRND